jgi:hypothetical protein
MNVFRQKCYLSALEETKNLPNSKELLSQISSTTKLILYNLHAFTPTAFYASIISRQRLDHQKSQMISSDSTETILQTVLFDSNPQRVRSDRIIKIVDKQQVTERTNRGYYRINMILTLQTKKWKSFRKNLLHVHTFFPR